MVPDNVRGISFILTHCQTIVPLDSIFFVATRVPETKGLSLEEIEQEFAGMEKARMSTELVSEAQQLLEV
jgi:hypothetical protein